MGVLVNFLALILVLGTASLVVLFCLGHGPVGARPTPMESAAQGPGESFVASALTAGYHTLKPWDEEAFDKSGLSSDELLKAFDLALHNDGSANVDKLRATLLSAVTP